MAGRAPLHGRVLRGGLAAGCGALLGVLAVLVPASPAVAASGSSAPGASPSPSGSYTPIGTPLHGGDDAASSSALSGPGQYTDTLAAGSKDVGTDGAIKYYSITLHKGDKAFVSATIVPPAKFSASGSLELEVDITSVDESLCYFQDTNLESNSANMLSPLTVVLATGEVGGADWDNDCPSNGTFTVKVTRSGDAFQNVSMPLELGYHLEPKVLSSGVPGFASTGSDLPISAGTDQLRSFDAGFSFDDAPELRNGRYQDSISSGQTRFVRVPLQWGQRFGFFVAGQKVSGNGGDGLIATASLYNPIRTTVALADGTTADFESGFGGGDAQLSGTSAVLVRYANRESTNDKVAPYSVAGDYYLALTLGYGDDGTAITVPYTMQIDIVGSPEQAPSYSYSAVADASAAGDDSGSGDIVWVLVAVVVVAGVLVGWLVLARRRRPAHAGTPARGGSGLGSAPTTGIPAGARRSPPQQGRSSVPPGPPPQGRSSVPPGPQQQGRSSVPPGPQQQGRSSVPPGPQPQQGGRPSVPPGPPQQSPQQSPKQPPPHQPPQPPQGPPPAPRR